MEPQPMMIGRASVPRQSGDLHNYETGERLRKAVSP